MIYLSGHVRDGLEKISPLLGYIYTPITGYRHIPRVAWAGDNGCFSHPELFSWDRYADWLEARSGYRSECLFVTARDAVADAATTLLLSEPMLPELRALGYRAALVFQDGLERMTIPWNSFDAAFIGGSTAWKLGPAWELSAEAKARGKWVHVGRVNSWRRLRACQTAGVDSVDGTLLRFGPDINTVHLKRWLKMIRIQPSFDLFGGAK